MSIIMINSMTSITYEPMDISCTSSSTPNIMKSYIETQTDTVFLEKLGIELHQNVRMYPELYISSITDNIDEYLHTQIIQYIKNCFSRLDTSSTEINYYISYITSCVANNFHNVCTSLKMEHLVKLTFDSSSSKNISKWKNIYWEEFFDYLTNQMCFTNDSVNFQTLVTQGWGYMSFDNKINFLTILSKMEYRHYDVSQYDSMISDSFDGINLLDKLFEHILNMFAPPDVSFNPNTVFKKSFSAITFTIGKMKSNGYLLFEKYYGYLQDKYLRVQKRETVLIDKQILNYFISVISKKPSDNVNKQVNQMLFTISSVIRDYMESLESTEGFRQVQIRKASKKYIDFDLDNFQRDNAFYITHGYSFDANTQAQYVDFESNADLGPYIDIYKVFYESKYPDRKISFNPFRSTLVVRMSFLDIEYLVHLALIQYIVLDCIMKADHYLTIEELSNVTKFQKIDIVMTVNSLVKSKLIKRSADDDIENVVFCPNNEFSNDNTKISISSHVFNLHVDSNANTKVKKSQDKFMFSREQILTSNIYDYVKKNKTFYLDTMMVDLQYKVPFNYTIKTVENILEKMLKEEHIEKQNVSTNETEQIMYRCTI